MLTGVRWASCVAAMLVVAACDTGTSPSATDDLHGGWQLVALELSDGTVVRPTNAETYTATFTADDRLHVSADCNVCNGSYAATASTLTVGPLACTRAFCGPDSLHDSYLAALASGRSWERNNAELFIAYDGGTLRFSAELRAHTAVLRTDWRLGRRHPGADAILESCRWSRYFLALSQQFFEGGTVGWPNGAVQR